MPIPSSTAGAGPDKQRVAVCLFFLLLGGFCLHRIIDVDIWWHLKAGQLIAASRAVPTLDPFSFPSAARPWIDLHWLYQLLVYAVYRGAGATGLLLLKGLVILSTFALLFRIALPRAGGVATLIPALLAALAFERYLPRPEIFSELLIALYLFILFSFKHRNSRLVYALPFLQVVWVNTEGLFILGVALVAAFAVGEKLAGTLPHPAGWREDDVVTGTRWRTLAGIAAACALACLANPYGIDGALFPFTLYTRLGRGTEVFSATIAELSPPPFLRFSVAHPPLFFYNLLAVVSALSFLANLRRLGVSRLLVYGGFLYLSVLARRNIPLFACVALPITALNLAECWEGVVARLGPAAAIRAERGRRVLAGALVVVLAALIWAVVTNRFAARVWPLAEFGGGFSPYLYPVKAVDFIERAGLSGNLFNNIGIGGYLCWRGGPARKVFIDGRLEVHEREFYTDYIRVMHNPMYWDDLAVRYRIGYVVLQHTMEDTQLLISRLRREKDWVLVYVDDVSVVFARNAPEYRAAIDRYGPLAEAALARRLEEETDGPAAARSGSAIFRRVEIPFHALHRATVLAELGLYDDAAAVYREALAVRPDLATIHYDLGLVFMHRARYGDAIAELQAALKRDPRNAAMLDSLGCAFDKNGDPVGAEAELRRAIRVDPFYLKAKYDLAHVLMAAGRSDEAQQEIDAMLRLNPDNAHLRGILAEIHLGRREYVRALDEAWNAVRSDGLYGEGFALIGSAYRRLGRLDAATAAYARAVELDDRDVTARNNLGVCLAQSGRYEAARKQWEAALELQPTHAGVRANLDRLSQLEGKGR